MQDYEFKFTKFTIGILAFLFCGIVLFGGCGHKPQVSTNGVTAGPFTLVVDGVEKRFTHEEFKRQLGFTDYQEIDGIPIRPYVELRNGH